MRKPITPDEVLPLTEQEQAYLDQTVEMVDLKLKEQDGVVHLSVDELPLTYSPQERFRGKLLERLIVMYEKAGWDTTVDENDDWYGISIRHPERPIVWSD